MNALHLLFFVAALRVFAPTAAERSSYEIFGVDVPYATVREAVNALKPLDDPLPPERPDFVALLGNLTAAQSRTLLKKLPGIVPRKLAEASTPLRVTVDAADPAVRDITITVEGERKRSVTQASAYPKGSILMFAPAAAVPERYTIYLVRLK